jgi:hypothetical protein
LIDLLTSSFRKTIRQDRLKKARFAKPTDNGRSDYRVSASTTATSKFLLSFQEVRRELVRLSTPIYALLRLRQSFALISASERAFKAFPYNVAGYILFAYIFGFFNDVPTVGVAPKGFRLSLFAPQRDSARLVNRIGSEAIDHEAKEFSDRHYIR